MDHTQIQLAAPRKTAQIYLPDGRTFEGPVGTRLEDFLKVACGEQDAPVVAALVNREIRDLCWPVLHDAEVMPLTTATGDGLRILQRSLSFLLVVAAKELFPDAQGAGGSLPDAVGIVLSHHGARAADAE